MEKILKKTSMLDILILFAVLLAIYMIFLHFNKPKSVRRPLSGYDREDNLAPVEDSESEPESDSELEQEDDVKPVESMKNNDSALTKGYDRNITHELHGASDVKNYHLLKKGEVLDKKNYICNPECPCDERSVGQSLRDVRSLFITKDQHQLGDVTDMKGTPLEDSFKLGDGKEHRCQPKPMDVELISKLLNCKGKQN